MGENAKRCIKFSDKVRNIYARVLVRTWWTTLRMEVAAVMKDVVIVTTSKHLLVEVTGIVVV